MNNLQEPRSERTAYIGLGSNLGDREANIQRAVQAIGSLPGITLNQISSLYETRPVGFQSSNLFLNGVLAVKLSSDTTAAWLLKQLLLIEKALGRDRRAGMDRTIDLDLLFIHEDTQEDSPEPYRNITRGSKISNADGGESNHEDKDTPPFLELPHPRLHKRGFVLIPWAEIAADTYISQLGDSVAGLLKKLDKKELNGISARFPGRKF